jgi:hypothetical protein
LAIGHGKLGFSELPITGGNPTGKYLFFTYSSSNSKFVIGFALPTNLIAYFNT